MDHQNMANHPPSVSADLTGNVHDASESSLNTTMQALIGMMEYLSTDATPMTPPPTNMKYSSLESFSAGATRGVGGGSESCCLPLTPTPYGDSSSVHPANVSDDEKLSANSPVSPACSGYAAGIQQNNNNNLEDAKQHAVTILRGHLVQVLENKLCSLLNKKQNKSMMVVDDNNNVNGLDKGKLHHIAKAFDEKLFHSAGSLERYCDLSTLDRRIRQELAMFVREQQAAMERRQRRVPCQRRPSKHSVIQSRHSQKLQQERQRQLSGSKANINSLPPKKQREHALRDILKSPKFELTRKLVKEINLLKLRRTSTSGCFVGCGVRSSSGVGMRRLSGVAGGGACGYTSGPANIGGLTLPSRGKSPTNNADSDMSDSEILEDVAGDHNTMNATTSRSDDEETNVGARHSLPEPVSMLFFNTPLVDIFDKAPIERLRKQNWNALLGQAMTNYKAYKDYIAKNKG